ncbi:CobW family GTP-binding protein [Brachybacterium sacelli]|uniref:G3E family GTPase n=1 Tax=Brachybacterium sacelli TaxID=173364 RepID=A0ABS4WYH7_9MICO|nr:GTP-binding protein [Brachybacterium sacelli]MBP2381254.1 G3E family GTPase [Brachybacterium sacelli]
MSDAPGSDRFQRHEGGRHSTPVAVVTAVDAVLRDALVASLLLDTAGAVALRYEVEARSSSLRRVIVAADGVVEDELVDLDHPCVSCAMREDAVPVLTRLAHLPAISAIVLAPPLSADPSIVVGTLRPHQDSWHLAAAASAVGLEAVRGDLLGEDTLAERGLQWAAGDSRSVGEALAAQIEYADLLVLDGDPAGPGAELVEHLRAPEQDLVVGPYSLDAGTLLGRRLDHLAGLRRRDARCVEPYGGPTQHGTWTLDLSSARPFHPRRLLENIEDLGAGRLRERGRFWVPDRPDSICQWDGAGGQVSIGAVWRAGRDLPTTRLVVTGIEAADAERVRAAFGRSLLTEREWADGLAPWLGVEDHLSPWLGERDARV